MCAPIHIALAGSTRKTAAQGGEIVCCLNFKFDAGKGLEQAQMK
jgi:hypothetical protein